MASTGGKQPQYNQSSAKKGDYAENEVMFVGNNKAGAADGAIIHDDEREPD
jgi:hypothetical protein